jgi:hypothetical protein
MSSTFPAFQQPLDGEPVPQRFAFRGPLGNRCYGVCLPHCYPDGSVTWMIKIDLGFAGFKSDPWDIMQAITGTKAVEWIDNDYGWRESF